MTRENFRLLLDMWMMLDPWPLSQKQSADFDYFLLAKARDFGYRDVLEAYHNLETT